MNKKSLWLFGIYLVVCGVYVLASQLPFLLEIRSAPPFTVFPLYHTNSDFDFNAYLSVITQGKHGAWLMRDAYTTEPTNPTLFYFFFILVGKAATILQLEPQVAYHLVRSVSIMTYIVTLYLLSRRILGPLRGFWGAVFGIIGTIAPYPFYREPEAYVTYTDWWGNIESLNRLDQMPHYMVSATHLFAILLLVYSFLSAPRIWKLMVAFALAVTAGLFFPPMLMPVLIGVPIAFILEWIRVSLKSRKPVLPDAKHLTMLIVVLSGIALPYLLMLRENTNGFPWDTWSTWEQARWRSVTAFDPKLFISFGLLPLLSLPAALRIFFPRGISGPVGISTARIRNLTIVVWAYLPFLLLPVTNLDVTFISKYRLTTMAPFVPLGILTAETAFMVYERLRVRLLRLIIFILVLATTVPVTASYLVKTLYFVKTTKIANRFYHYYIPVGDWEAIKFLKDHAPAGSVVLTNRFSGSLVPAYTGLTVFLGHHVHTKDFDYKNWQSENFYGNLMPEEMARQFLKEYRIRYVFFGANEQLRSRELKYRFLTPVYSNLGGTVVYEAP